MASTLVTTVGGSLSNSFVDIDDADAFIVASGCDPSNLTAWDELDDSAKEFRLRVSAQMMGTLPLRGVPAYEYQALCFPRTCQTVLDEIPSAVQEAQSLIAYLVINKNIANQEEQSSGGDILLENALVKSVEVMGVMRVGLQHTMDAATIKEQTSANRPLFYKALKSYGAPIWLLLKPYLSQFRGGTTPARTLSTVTLLESPDYEA